MKSNYSSINQCSHENVEDLNQRILSGNYSPAELAEWLEARAGTKVHPSLVGLHAKDVRNNAGLSVMLQRRQLDSLDHLSTQAIHADTATLGNCWP